jgi:hypothetical protein
VPRWQAERLAGFLQARGIPHRLREVFNDPVAPAADLEGELRSRSPAAGYAFDAPIIGRMLRFRLRRELRNVEGELAMLRERRHDVLVRPQDIDAAKEMAKQVLPEEPSAPGGEQAAVPAASDALELAAVTHLPWEDAWRLAQRLTAAGVPASVMADDPGQGRSIPLSRRVVPVGVRPGDLERARALLGPEDQPPAPA